jgi:hypothetical protein
MPIGIFLFHWFDPDTDDEKFAVVNFLDGAAEHADNFRRKGIPFTCYKLETRQVTDIKGFTDVTYEI